MKRLAVLLAVLLVVSGAAMASEHKRPPELVLKRGKLRQHGNLGSYCWSWVDGEGNGTAECADSFGHNWPRAKSAAAGAPARITSKYAERPDEIELTYYRRVDEDGYPKGGGHSLEYTAEERETDSGTVWDIRFELPDYEGHFYLRGFLTWEAGDASYEWHLRLG